jgi:hypothetical protein
VADLVDGGVRSGGLGDVVADGAVLVLVPHPGALEVEGALHAAGEVRVAAVQAGVDDRDGDALAGETEPLRLRRADLVDLQRLLGLRGVEAQAVVALDLGDAGQPAGPLQQLDRRDHGDGVDVPVRVQLRDPEPLERAHVGVPHRAVVLDEGVQRAGADERAVDPGGRAGRGGGDGASGEEGGGGEEAGQAAGHRCSRGWVRLSPAQFAVRR